MTAQFDLFPTAAAVFPPYLDPERVRYTDIRRESDGDHVGENEIGRLGNNRDIYVLTVEDKSGEILRHETFVSRGAAVLRRDEIEQKIANNRQRSLF